MPVTFTDDEAEAISSTLTKASQEINHLRELVSKLRQKNKNKTVALKQLQRAHVVTLHDTQFLRDLYAYELEERKIIRKAGQIEQKLSA